MTYTVQYITVLKIYFSGEITIIAFIFPWLKYFFCHNETDSGDEQSRWRYAVLKSTPVEIKAGLFTL